MVNKEAGEIPSGPSVVFPRHFTAQPHLSEPFIYESWLAAIIRFTLVNEDTLQ